MQEEDSTSGEVGLEGPFPISFLSNTFLKSVKKKRKILVSVHSAAAPPAMALSLSSTSTLCLPSPPCSPSAIERTLEEGGLYLADTNVDSCFLSFGPAGRECTFCPE